MRFSRIRLEFHREFCELDGIVTAVLAHEKGCQPPRGVVRFRIGIKGFPQERFGVRILAMSCQERPDKEERIDTRWVLVERQTTQLDRAINLTRSFGRVSRSNEVSCSHLK